MAKTFLSIEEIESLNVNLQWPHSLLIPVKAEKDKTHWEAPTGYDVKCVHTKTGMSQGATALLFGISSRTFRKYISDKGVKPEIVIPYLIWRELCKLAVENQKTNNLK